MKTHARVNLDVQGDVSGLRAEIATLRAELAALKESKVLEEEASSSLYDLRHLLKECLLEKHETYQSELAVRDVLNKQSLLLEQKEKALQSKDMVLKFRDATIDRASNKDINEALQEQKASFQAEIAELRRQMDAHPAVYDYAYQNVQLKAELDQIKKIVEEQEDVQKRRQKLNLIDQLSRQLAIAIEENESLRKSDTSKRSSTSSVDDIIPQKIMLDAACNTEGDLAIFTTPSRSAVSSPVEHLNDRDKDIAFWQSKLEKAEKAIKEEEEAHAKSLNDLQTGLITSKQYASTVESELTGTSSGDLSCS